jgi:hypothetical protein
MSCFFHLQRLMIYWHPRMGTKENQSTITIPFWAYRFSIWAGVQKKIILIYLFCLFPTESNDAYQAIPIVFTSIFPQDHTPLFSVYICVRVEVFCLWKLTLVLCRGPGDSSKWIQESSGCSWCRWCPFVGIRKPAGVWTVPLQFTANKSLWYCKYINKELISNIYLSQKVSPFLSKQFRFSSGICVISDFTLCTDGII